MGWVVAESCHQHDRNLRFKISHASENLVAISVRHSDIGDHQIGALAFGVAFCERGDRFRATVARRHGDAIGLQQFGQSLHHDGFIVGHQDVATLKIRIRLGGSQVPLGGQDRFGSSAGCFHGLTDLGRNGFDFGVGLPKRL